MRIHLFTLTYNNEATIEQFIKFYKDQIPNIVIHITDMGSTDNTLNLVKDCIITKYNDFYKSTDDWKNQCWKYAPADSIIICAVQDYIVIDPLLFNNCTVIQAKGYFTKDLNELLPTEENRNIHGDKYVIFDKQAIKEINFDGNNINPVGYVQIGEKKPNLFNLV